MAQIIFLVVSLVLALGLVFLVAREAATGGHDHHDGDSHDPSTPPAVGPDGEDQTEDIADQPEEASDAGETGDGDADTDKSTT